MSTCNAMVAGVKSDPKGEDVKLDTVLLELRPKHMHNMVATCVNGRSLDSNVVMQIDGDVRGAGAAHHEASKVRDSATASAIPFSSFQSTIFFVLVPS